MNAPLKKIIPDAVIRALWHWPRAVLATCLFWFPACSMRCIAVAGTKGKTSTAFFLHHILNTSGQKTALFSTAAVSDGSAHRVNARKMTTPDVFALHRFLARAKKNHCINAVIEVSSHALKQHRVWGISFFAVVITNLAPDHLDYHTSAHEYQTIHAKLFSKKTSLLIASPDIHTLVSVPSTIRSVPPIPHNTVIPAWWAPLQQTNINTAISAAQALGIAEEIVVNALHTLPCPPGRFESIAEGQSFRVIVDYAHSPKSLVYFLSRIRPLVSGKLIVVFGACGDRDKEQRPLMGRAIERFADTVILTTDDPYSEDPEHIADDVEAGFSTKTPIVILDRSDAIAHALSLANEHDCVCVLGKGAEQWQVFKNKKIPWDDRVVVRTLLTRAQASRH